MKILFLGAAGTVTGSSYVLTSGCGESILIDLGMFQGLPEIDELNYKPFLYDVSKLSGAVLTHAHLDHCGRLPILLPAGFAGNAYMTSATRDLAELSLLDTAKIAQQDRKPILFDRIQAQKMIDRFEPVAYREPFRVGPFEVTMRGAGHLMGAASLEIVDTQANSEIRKIIFSGDLGNKPEELLCDLEYLESADAVIMESTYGDRLHPKEDPISIIANEINMVSQSGGVLLIPSFALERSQELLHIIAHLRKDGRIDRDIPVYMDSPMADMATRIYIEHLELFNEHLQREVEQGEAFGFDSLQILKKSAQGMAIRRRPGAKVIIAGSGMMVGGRIVGHAGYYLGSSSTRLLIVGYQGEGTLGRQLLEGAQYVTIDKREIEVRATISQTQAMSSHADQGQLLEWLKTIVGIKKLVLTHGDDGPREALAQRVRNEIGITDVAMPHMHEEITL